MNIDTSNGHPAMDYKEHMRTYKGFLRGAVVVSVFVSLLLLFMLVTMV